MTHSKLLKVMGCNKCIQEQTQLNYVSSILIPHGCKIVFNLKNKHVLFYFFNKMA